MKRGLITFLIVITTICAYAQPPQGQGGGPGGGGGMPPRDRNMEPRSTTENLVLEHFPEIPDLSLKQREQVGTILTKERKDVMKQMEKLHQNDDKDPQTLTAKDLEKIDKGRAKADKKIKDIESKSNKKVEKVLTDEQYAVYLLKRTEFKFKGGGKRPPMKEKRGNSENSNRPSFPNNQQFDDFND